MTLYYIQNKNINTDQINLEFCFKSALCVSYFAQYAVN